jgi:alpha-beta hydrolase superfamily lysophospholipase
MAISLLLRQFFYTKMTFAKPTAEAKATGKPRSEIPHIAKLIAGIVAGLVAMGLIGLTARIAFGAAPRSAGMVPSVSAPLRPAEFSGLPALLVQVFARTPPWLYILFLALVAIGVSQLAARRVGFKRAMLVPSAMIGLSISGVASGFAALPVALLAWGLAAAAATVLLLVKAPRVGTEYEVTTGCFAIPGSTLPLVLIIGIFFTKYTVGVMLVYAPQLAHQMSFALPVSALYGIFSGVFVGQATSLWRLAARSAQPGSGRPAAPHIGKWIACIVCGVAVVAALGLGGLIVFGTATPPAELTSVSDPMRHIDFSDLPPLQHFKARDGQALSYRHYPGTGPDVVVLIHGSSGESSGMHAVAKTLSAVGDTVYAPDLRGHGHDGNPSDIGYIGQLDDDLVDFVAVIRPLHPRADVILVGHSSGGAFVLRIAEGPNAHWFKRFVVLSPAMPHGGETLRPYAGGWVTPFVGRIIAIKLLNKLGIRWFNGLPIIAFAVDPHASVPLDVTYSYRMQATFTAPQDAIARLSSIKQPLAVLVGSKDELMYADRFAPLINWERPDVPVTLVPGVDHMGMVTDPRALAAIATTISE